MIKFYSLIIVLVTIVSSGLYSQEKIDIKVDENLVNVRIINFNANCCSKFVQDFSINNNNNQIYLTIRDTSAQKCKCMCNFDLETNISQIPQGNYIIFIYIEELIQYGYPIDIKKLITKREIIVKDNYSKSPLSYDFKQSTCKSGTDVTITQSSSKEFLEIFPNPSASKVTLKFNLKSKADITFKLLNFLGKEVYSTESKDLTSGYHNIQINVNDLPQGLYLGKLSASNGQSQSVKLMWSK
jgi:hypothetical protein